MGGETSYFEKGNVIRVWISSIPVRDLDKAIGFYVDVLGLELVVEDVANNWAELGGPEPQGNIGLYVPKKNEKRQPGGDSGVILEVDSIFEFHRRLVDEEVPFKLKPERRGWGGIMAIFVDPDGNEIKAVEDPDHYRRFPRPERKRKERCAESARSCRRSASK
jgi:catechol 2,3-dioxygenase-like lactoylglutathione lyase family enzyme